MKNAGWFKYLKGFLFGRPMLYGQEAFGIDQYRAVTDLLEEYNVPIIMDLDIGHLSPMMPIITGAKVVSRFNNGEFSVEYFLED